MANVQSQSQVKRSGQKSSADIYISNLKARPRDDLRAAFAGNENKGPAGNMKNKSRGTHLKSRSTKASKEKTPAI